MPQRLLPNRFQRLLSADTAQDADVGRQRLRFGLVAAALLLFLCGVGYWTQHAVREYLHESLGDDLETLVEAKAAALRLWAKGEQDEARLWAEATLVRQLVQEIASSANETSEPGAAARRQAQLERLRELLSPETRERDSQGFLIVDATGEVLAASTDTVVGQRLATDSVDLIADTLQRGTVLSKPVRVALDLGLTDWASGAVMVAASVMRDDSDRELAVLMFLLDPRDYFSRLVSVGTRGEGDAYAFDANGLMLSETRHIQQLRDLGLVAAEPNATSILHVAVRDPGRNLLRGVQSIEPGGPRPLTRLAASAVAGESGVDVVGYRDYRGVRVVGAWQWLPELELGIAVEVPVQRAFGPLRPLRLAFGGLFFLLAIATGIVLFNSYRVGRLQRRVRAIQRVGQYTLEEKIGEGGMGIVYRARHALLRRPTAVKLLKGTEATPEAVARFEQEVQLTSQLTHPNTIEIYDFGRTAEGVFYYAMELLPGVDLARLIELDGPQPPARVIHILRQACAALSEAHAAGLIHRDIKPLNIILCERGGLSDFVKVLDFGLVKQLNPTGSKLAVTEAFHGTPLYIPPERLRDPSHADARTDIYALGCVAFNLLTGKDPYQGRTPMEMCYHVLSSEPPRRAASLAPAPIPEELDALVDACLAKDPELRPSGVDAMMLTLDALAESLPWGQEQAKRWWCQNEDLIGTTPLDAGKISAAASDT